MSVTEMADWISSHPQENDLSNVCPVLTPAQRQYAEIQHKIEQALKQRIQTALQEATEQAEAAIRAAGLDLPPPSKGYFTATIHQALYCTLCKADPETFAGGDANIALAVIRNAQKVARHYWGANIELSESRGPQD
jgi:hypothetical protein